MRLKKLICPIVALLLSVSCFAGTVCAVEYEKPADSITVSRASGRFTVDVPAKTVYKASSSFPLEVGEIVTIKASYSPFSANVDFGLIAPNGRLYNCYGWKCRSIYRDFSTRKICFSYKK